MINSELKDVFKQTPRNLTGYVVRTTKDNTNYVYHDATNNLVSAQVERTIPSGKFFGYAVGQKLTVELLTKTVDTTSDRMRLVVKDKDNGTNVYSPYFFLDTVEYNETATKATLVGYDLIAGASSHTLKEVGITYPITLYNFANKVVTFLSGSIVADFTDVNPTLAEANFEGNEDLHTVLAAIAEATGTICYCSTGNQIVFRHLSTSTVDDSFDGQFYFDFKTQEPITLTQVISATELGDNYKSGSDGYAQVIRDNPFLTLRDDIATLVDAIAAKVIGITMVPYTIKHRGNPCYEPGDRIAITNLDDEVKYIYYGNESFTFNGGFVATSEWNAGEEENPDAAPTSLGAAISQTFAKVDKVNKQIQLVVSETNGLKSDVANLKVTADGIESSVTSNSDAIGALEKKTSQSMTADEVEILVKEKVGNAGSEVTTSTGFTFDKNGLTIAKSGSSIETQITEDGMTVSRIGDAVLVANNEGVQATNLHARTYLIIGTTSRFEDYEDGLRTACFWIGTKTAEEV